MAAQHSTNQHPGNPYSFAHEVQSEGSAVFRCSHDVAANPWLALPPHHPVVVQTQSFWTAVGASTELQGLEATKWTALTWIDWELGCAAGGHATHGVYRRDSADDGVGYSLELLNEAQQAVVTIKGRGVIFRNRNFEEWRKGAKAEAKRSAPAAGFTFATPEALGLSRQERVLVAPFEEGASFKQGTGFVEALVTPENGFPPGNPMIGGSGDHVNSTHIHELARQSLFLIKGRCDIDTSGTMTLNRYIELGTPLRLIIADEGDHAITFAIEQLGKACAKVMLRWKAS